MILDRPGEGVTVRCLDCGELFEGEDYDSHVFASVVEARTAVAKSSDWTLFGDGAVGALCGPCVEIRLCLALGGHNWEERQGPTRTTWVCVDCGTPSATKPEMTR